MSEERGYLTCAETAKLVRAAVKREFPGTKFSVRSSNYAGGASIDVNWTDGPTQSAVDEIVQDYAGGRFDGMQDLAYSVQHWLTPDGIATVQRVYGHTHDNEVITPDRPEGARLVHFHADYVFTHRTVSDELAAQCGEQCSDNGLARDEQCAGCGTWMNGNCWVTLVDDWTRFACSQTCAGRLLARSTSV